MIRLGAFCRRHAGGALLAAAVALGSVPLAAQVRTVDPNAAIDGDLVQSHEISAKPVEAIEPTQSYNPPPQSAGELPGAPAPAPAPLPGSAAPSVAARQVVPQPAGDTTYHEDDLIGAAEGVFGKGAEGVARMIEDLLKKQGEPDGYIVGREAGGAFIFGVRYGSGTLYHKVEGQRPIYWTGPSVGFDAGANAANTFVLVYNLYDTEDLYERFPAGEGDAYIVGGLTASYLRKGKLVLIPIRMGAGLRLGVNAGYMKFSKKQKWLPF